MKIIPKSQFQEKFPLSPKKLKKKMLGTSVGGFVLSVVLGLIPAFINMLMAINNDQNIAPGLVGTHFILSLLLWTVVFFVIYMMIYRLYWKAYINRYFYDCNDGFVTIKKGVFTPTEIHVQYQKIQDVYVDQDLIDRIMGLYDVHIASATVSSGIEAHIDGVDQATAEGLKNFLLGSIRGGVVSGSDTAGVQTIPQQQVVTPVKFTVPENISSATFPISSKWMTLQVFNSIASGIVAVIVILWIFFVPGKSSDISIAEDMGISIAGSGLYLFGIFVLVFAFNIIKTYIWRKNYKFEMLPDYLFVHEGIISTQEQHIPYDRIQDVIVQQGFIGRIIGLANVYIQNAVAVQASPKKKSGQANGVLIPGQSPENAKKLSEVVRSVLSTTKNQQTGL
jgi:putative membrane protein